jgi:hypothetical protein
LGGVSGLMACRRPTGAPSAYDARMNILNAAASYFGIVFGAGFLFGAVRVPLLVPRLGVRTAELLEMPLMFVVIVLAASFVVRRFALPADAWTRAATGLLALLMVMAAELLLAVALQGLTPAAYLASRDPVSGGVYLALLVVMAAMPLWLAWRHRHGAAAFHR